MNVRLSFTQQMKIAAVDLLYLLIDCHMSDDASQPSARLVLEIDQTECFGQVESNNTC